MEFELNPDQRALADGVARLLAKHYGFEQRRAVAASDTGWSQPVWDRLADMGTCSLLVPEAHGGFGGTAMDLLAVMPELGRTLALEPYLASAVLGATALRAGAPEQVQAQFLPGIATGELLVAWAHDEPGARHAPQWIETRARREGERWILDGGKCNVLHGTAAAMLVVSARIDGTPDNDAGIALFLVQAAAPGLGREDYRLVDDSPAADFSFPGVEATPLCLDTGTALAAITATHAVGIAAVCADALGAMEAAFDLTTSYIKTRQQFGRAIGENQALRHRVAEMFVSLEMCRSMVIVAAVAASGQLDDLAHADLQRAKLMIGRHGRSFCHSAIQLHGGIGMTEEYAVGHYLRRLTLVDQLFGDADAQAARLGSALAA